MAPGPAIAIRGLRVRRGGTLILDDLAIDVAAGSVTGLLGPNGAGKTTLIRCIVGVQIVEAGSVAVRALAFGVLGLDVAGATWAVICLAVMNAVLGMALGLFVSAFARSEFQAVQFLPAFIMPQILLCGLLAPREEMAQLLYWISWALPLTYAYGALDRVTKGLYGWALAADIFVVCGFIAAALVLGAGTLRRRTA